MLQEKQLYHIHRNGNMDDIWHIGNQILIDDNFTSIYYLNLLKEEDVLTSRYGDNYNLDYIISTMEEINNKNIILDTIKDDFNKLLTYYYFLRREKALEEGRKIFNPSAPCRFHSIFLSSGVDLCYWASMVGNNSFNHFLLNLDGNLFMSSDEYFPNEKLSFDNQVEESKKYWKPKIKKLVHSEFVFQGKAKIIE